MKHVPRGISLLTVTVLALIGLGVGLLETLSSPDTVSSPTSACLFTGRSVLCPEGGNRILTIAIGGSAGCVETYTNVEIVFPMYCKDDPNRAWKTFYDALDTISSNCQPLWEAEDGTAGPIFCRDGQPNPTALRYYSPLGLRSLERLGHHPTTESIERTLCALLPHGSNPIATEEYDLAARQEGWPALPSGRVFSLLEGCPS